MKYTLALMMSLGFYTTYSQQVIDVNNTNYNALNMLQVVGGNPVTNAKYVSLVEGSPYLQEEWIKGKLVTEQGYVFQDVFLRLNLIENTIHYKDPKGNEMIATMPIREVILPEQATSKTLRFVNSNILPSSKKGWYLLLHNANVSFFKFYDKILSENRPYNSATTEQRIMTKEKYFVMMKNVSYPIKNIKDLQALFMDKQKDVEMFIKTLDTKKPLEERMIEIVEYYNVLLK
ncbi:MAG TPA: hypothetical protein VEX63_11275 [Flavisolibacter sp.]|jgi:hypothetical protein|nr:hypothetical protein [Flavisolibacter sp.]